MKLVSAVQTGVPALSVADAALLASAHLDLLQAQADGVPVLGSTAGAELVSAAYQRMFDLFADDTTADLTEVAA